MIDTDCIEALAMPVCQSPVSNIVSGAAPAAPDKVVTNWHIYASIYNS